MSNHSVPVTLEDKASALHSVFFEYLFWESYNFRSRACGMHTVSLKIHIRFSFLVERWFAACSQLCSRLSRGSRFTTQIAALPVLPCPLVSSRLQYTSLTSFLVCPTQHVLPTTSSSFCYFFMVSSDFGEHWTWNPLPSACWDWTHSPRHDYPIVFFFFWKLI